MYLSKIQIVDYKCFLDSGEAELDANFNVVVGKNNAGKSALLEYLNLAARPATNPHRSPEGSEAINRDSRLNFSIKFDAQDLIRLIRFYGVTIVPSATLGIEAAPNYWQAFLDQNQFELSYAMVGNRIDLPSYPSIRIPGWEYSNRSLRVGVKDGEVVPLQVDKSTDSALAGHVLETMKSRTFVFRAERLRVARSPPAEEEVLRADASNLPAVLHRLQEDKYAMDAYTNALRTVIPSVSHVSVGFRNGQFVIQVMPDYSTPGASYVQTLEDCGTGLGQVLAILYVVLRMDSGVIVVDEPNSFLHPGATKQLINIMRQNRRNQYIISTHSPEVIVASSPCRVLQVSRQNSSSRISSYNSGAIASIRNLLSELGSSLSDVFGIDSVIWVEGETERDAFPLVLEAASIEVPPGIAFVPMRASELGAKRRIAEISANLHERLASASTLVPTFCAFAFDGELRDQAERRRINEVVKGRAHFLPRRMLENYFFDAEAIAAAVSFGAEKPINADQVRSWLVSNAGFTDSAALEHENAKELDGAKVLKDLFWKLGTVEYSKTRDGIRILEAILASRRESLSELTDYVAALLPKPAG